MEQNGKEIKIAVLQEQMKSVQKDVTTILGNHLPHLDTKIDDNHKAVMYEISKLASTMNGIKVKTAYYVGGATAVWGIIQLIVSLKK